MTTVNWLLLDSALLRLGETYLRNSYSIPSNFKLILCNGSISQTSTWETILGLELTETNGYVRDLVTFNAGSVNANIASFGSPQTEFTASGASLNYNNAVLIANGSTTSNKSVVSMSESTDLIEVTGHGLSLNDAVMFTGDGTIATGLSKDTIYYARDISTDTFKVSATNGGAAIDLTADSSGSLLLRYANGFPLIYATGTEEILSGQTFKIDVNWNWQNTGV
jgi:hypothetical protein